jgi:glycosyltransferase involved in cell wall biosynthesis
VPSESDVADESALYELADHVFCPSELVARSMVTAGVPESKLLRTSYGWSPERVDSSAAIGGPPSSRPFTALFLGTVCLRKGAHLLAAAWRDAAIDGRLRLVGALAPEFAGEREHALDGRGVERLGHRRDVAALLREADVFAFPTLEEGSALVVYEAAAAGLAIVTTPMGAGGVLRAGVDAVVLDPLDHDAWVATLRELAADGARRAELGRSARARVADFTWRDVARRRLAMLREAGADLPRAAAR